MAIVVTFTGKTALPGADTGYRIWSYKVEASPAGDIPANTRIALGLPRDMEVKDPTAFPNVTELVGMSLIRDGDSSRQYASRVTSQAGGATISFVAPAAESTAEMLLAKLVSGQPPTALPFATVSGGTQAPAQRMVSPVHGPPVYNGRPPSEFAGMLPYASELFGIYQPLGGWYGSQNSLRVAEGIGDKALAGLNRESFSGGAARTLRDKSLAALAKRLEAVDEGVLSPVGLVQLFRQYFFEFDTFLGPPAGHLWLSPGGTVELIEVSTRRTLIEKTAEQAEETSRKVEETLTEQDDIANAVKEDNANDTKLGVSASGGASAFGIYHAEASASFGMETTVKRSSEETHKHSRTQSAKVTSEIKRNFKTTFKTVTETTDVSSRRYVVQNTSDRLVNYELRRKMRKVGVQLQHIGARLCWQVYIPTPGRRLGLGDMIHIVAAPDLTSLRKPEPPPPLVAKTTQFTGSFPIRKVIDTTEELEPNEEMVHHDPPFNPGITCHDNDHHAVAVMGYTPPPPEQGYVVGSARLVSVAPGRAFQPHLVRPFPDKSGFEVFSLYFHTGDLSPIGLTFEVTWEPPQTNDAHERYKEELKAYNKEVGALQQIAYASALRDRLALVAAMRPRPSEDLRKEERQTIYGDLIHKLKPFDLFENDYLGSELLRQIFDVDEMLYFVAPDYWKPRELPPQPPPPPDPPFPTNTSVGKYPLTDPSILADRTVLSWYSHTDSTKATDPEGVVTDEFRVNYLITEQTQPAPMGSSLGWLIQIDGDVRRNEFLNAAWAKAVLPIRPGRETAALKWLRQAHIEGEAALDLDYAFQQGDPDAYRGKKVGQVLDLLAAELQAANTLIGNTLATEELFENGFDPLEGGFRPAKPYEVFDQWLEVLPTDQVVAVEVQYDPKTGQQI